ncbi:MAG: hypothetical protein AABX69_01925 [Nanoarchaeota archaeon]
MRLKSFLNILLQTSPIAAGAVVTYFFWQNSIVLTTIFVGMVTALLLFTYQKGDIFALIYGTILGFLLEVFEIKVAGFHSFSNPDVLGMPFWMPIAWGYGFVLMKRIGIIIYKDAQKVV